MVEFDKTSELLATFDDESTDIGAGMENVVIGLQGPPGPAGPRGFAGPAGESPTLTIEETASGVLIEAVNANGTSQIGYVLHGAAGPAGPTGPAGPAGPAGIISASIDSDGNLILTVPD